MKYGIIFSVDCTNDRDDFDFVPEVVLQTCDQTEDDDSYDYDYLGDSWKGGHHSKWVGVLDQEEFDEFVSSTGLRIQDVETMGSLGVSWSFPGLAPAISFTGGGGESVIQDAFVTPIPDIELKNRIDDEEWQGRCWDRVKSALLRRYE